MDHTDFPNAAKRTDSVWMLYVTTKAVGIELNMQLSEFTLQNHKMTLLDQNIKEDPDFAETSLHTLKDASEGAHVQKLFKQRTDSGGALSVDATTFT